jgi:hypothetical protein
MVMASPAALRLVSVPLDLDEFRKSDDQSSEFLCLAIGQPLVREGDGIWRLSIHMRQGQPFRSHDSRRGSARSPWTRKTALRHRTSIRRVDAEGLSGDMNFRNLRRLWAGRLQG